jgi:pimeloyl-ACP methyl ester carboxylesterase
MYAKDYTVYMFSRKDTMPEGCSTRDMALHVKQAMDTLGIEKAHILGVSMGGMIAQHLAADFPEKVNKLVLVVTAARSNPILRGCVEEWVDQARRGDHTALMGSNLEKIYSEKYYRQNKWMVPLLGLLTKPKSYDRFLVQAQAVLNHNAWDRLEDISCPTLVMGGAQDKCLGGEASREIAGKIPGAKLRMYEAWGHGLYEEEMAFNRHVLEFLRED